MQSGGDMVKLMCFVKRKPGMSIAEFHRYWREVHGPLVARDSTGLVLRYQQCHRALEDYDREGSSDFDGVAEQWFASLEDFHKYVASPRESESDGPNFLDEGALAWILTEEPEVFVDKVPAA